MVKVSDSEGKTIDHYQKGMEIIKDYAKLKNKDLLEKALYHFGESFKEFKGSSANSLIAIANCKMERNGNGDVESAIKYLEDAINIEDIFERHNKYALLVLKLALERMGEKIVGIENSDEAHICLGKFHYERPVPDYAKSKENLKKAAASEKTEIRLMANKLLIDYNLISPLD